MECAGSGATPPASLFEITLGVGSGNKDFYDVSLVDGYNLPMVALPTRGAVGACNATGCVADLNLGCPKELQVVGQEDEGGVVACKSACEAFGLDQYCCSGQFANPNTCRPSFYSTVFKKACPRAYSYAFDDGTSTFTCQASEYAIIFCPVATRIKRPSNQFPAPPTQGQNGQFMAPPAQNTATPPPTQGQNGQFMAPPTENTPTPPTQGQNGQVMAPPIQNAAMPPAPNQDGQFMAPPAQGTAVPTQDGPFTAPPTENTAAPTTQNQDPIGQIMGPPGQNQYPNGGMGRVVETQSSSGIASPVRFPLLIVFGCIALMQFGTME